MRTKLLGVVCTLTLSTLALSQRSLDTINPFASNNSGSAGGAVYFDVNVTSASGIQIQSLDMNYTTAAVGLPVGVDLYTIPGSAYGNETNSAAWTLQGSGTGTMAGINQPTSCTFATPIALTPGTYGFALIATGGAAHAYTNGLPTNLVFSNDDLALTLGSALNVPWTGTPFYPRVWNGTIHYSPTTFDVDFIASQTYGSAPLTVQFTDWTYSPVGLQQWLWDFNNDGTVDSTLQNPSFTFPVEGNYTVKLTVIDNNSAGLSKTKPNFIGVDTVIADFSANVRVGLAPLIVQFTDTTVGGPTTWAWDFNNDGNSDSTQQNPTWGYPVAGQYTVALTVTDAVSNDTETKVGFIVVGDPSQDPGTADLIELQFNEERTGTVANTATGATVGRSLAVTGRTFGDAGRVTFRGNEPGYGMLAETPGSLTSNIVDTGWSMTGITNMTAMWWHKVEAGGTASTNPFGYAWGTSTVRCFYGGAAGNGIFYRGSAIGDFLLTDDIRTGKAGVWQHHCVVIDDTNGVATWYVDAQPRLVRNFTPGTHVVNAGLFRVGSNSTTSAYTAFYSMDDFRLYGRALSQVEVLVASARGENPSASTYGAGCNGPTGAAPTIGATGLPALGSNTFQITLSGAEAGRPTALNLGLVAVNSVALPGITLPFDVSFLLGTGCKLEADPLVGVPVPQAGGTASVPLAIPATPTLKGVHVYGQFLVLGTNGAVTKGLDINMQ